MSAVGRTILGVRDEEPIRKFSSTSIRLGSSSDRERVRWCEPSRRIATGSWFFLDFASLNVKTGLNETYLSGS